MVGIMYHTGLERFRMFIVAHQRENLLGNPLREALNLFTKYLGLARIQVVDPGFLRIVKEAHDRCLLWSDPFESGQDAAENCGPKRLLCHTAMARPMRTLILIAAFSKNHSVSHSVSAVTCPVRCISSLDNRLDTETPSRRTGRFPLSKRSNSTRRTGIIPCASWNPWE